nr:glycosyltransferase family 2 protein [uncultured Carboxylicivirga sp.]
MILSIITVNLNNSNGLRKTFESVINQTYTNFEQIIIDGGSTDGSIDVIIDYEVQYKEKQRQLYWISEPDNGIYNAMNKAIKVANGQYCLFLNSGDWLFGNEVLSSVFDQKQTSDLIITQLLKFKSEKEKKITQFDTIDLNLILKSSLPHPSTYIRTELIKEFGGFNEALKIVSDWEFFLRVLLLHNCTYKVSSIINSCFDMTGISNDASHRESLILEREEIIKKYISPILIQANDKILALDKKHDQKSISKIRKILQPFKKYIQWR